MALAALRRGDPSSAGAIVDAALQLALAPLGVLRHPRKGCSRCRLAEIVKAGVGYESQRGRVTCAAHSRERVGVSRVSAISGGPARHNHS